MKETAHTPEDKVEVHAVAPIEKAFFIVSKGLNRDGFDFLRAMIL